MKRFFCLFPVLLAFMTSFTGAQVMSVPSSGFTNIGSHDAGTSGLPVGLGLISSEQMTNNLYGILTNMRNRDAGENASISISKLDLKAPSKARREYEKGFKALLRKDYESAIVLLSKSLETYPNFVAAHNALGSAYLILGENVKAQNQFTEAVVLDDHLPNSHLNLGVAYLALKDYQAAEQSLQKASSIAPLDISLLQALVYGQFVNKDYPAVIATRNQLHKGKHEGTAAVHYLAAGAWEAQNNVVEAQRELELLLKEAPDFPAADEVRGLLQQYKVRAEQSGAKQEAVPKVTFSFSNEGPTSEQASQQATRILQDLKERLGITEAEAAQANAIPQVANVRTESASSINRNGIGTSMPAGVVVRANVDEVAVFFAATDHGKSVMGLTGSDVEIRDNQQVPAAILSFRNESQLPLRLGLIVDTSDSVSERFSFEQKAAIKFLEKVVTSKEDEVFVVGVNNMVLLVQDFTSDQAQMSHAISEIVPSGGTALWDAVVFGADKLAGAQDPMPVARVLVVISDGKNNSSTVSFKEAVEHAQRAEVAVYTVSTREFDDRAPDASVGDHALRTLSELTGGAAFVPGSIRRLNDGIADLQQAIRGRYMISYRPDGFQRNGSYHAIDIKAQKDGHKLKVYARKGYYASDREDEVSRH